MAERKGAAKRCVLTNGPAIVVPSRVAFTRSAVTTPNRELGANGAPPACAGRAQPYGGCAARPAPAAPLVGPRDARFARRERPRPPHTRLTAHHELPHSRARCERRRPRHFFGARQLLFRTRTRDAASRPHTPHAQHRSRAPGPPPRTSSCCARSRATARASGPSSRRTCRAARASSAGSGGTTS